MLPELTTRLEFNTRCPISVAGCPLKSRRRLLWAKPATNTHPKTEPARFSRDGDFGNPTGADKDVGFSMFWRTRQGWRKPGDLLTTTPWAGDGAFLQVLQGPLRRALFLSLDNVNSSAATGDHMEGYKRNLLLIFLVASSQATAGEARVVAQIASTAQLGGPSLGDQTLNFPEDVDFSLEALYPARKNQTRAKTEILYSCVDGQSGGLIVPCYITIDPPVARNDSGGHYQGHSEGRPTGHH